MEFSEVRYFGYGIKASYFVLLSIKDFIFILNSFGDT